MGSFLCRARTADEDLEIMKDRVRSRECDSNDPNNDFLFFHKRGAKQNKSPPPAGFVQILQDFRPRSLVTFLCLPHQDQDPVRPSMLTETSFGLLIV